MQVITPWQAELSPTNSQLWAVNNPHSLPEPYPADYRQTLEWHGDNLIIDVALPDRYFRPSQVLLYPQVYFNIKDRELPWTRGGDLPVQVKNLQSLNTEFAYKILAGDLARANIAAEIFVHNSPSPRNKQGPEDTRTYELMFWAARPSDPSISLGPVLMDTPTFTVHRKVGNRAYIAFIMKQPPASGDPVGIEWVSLIELANALSRDTGLIDPVDPEGYVTAVEIGSETWAGEFTVEFSRMRNEVQVRMADVVPPVLAPGGVDRQLLTSRLVEMARCLETLTDQNESAPFSNYGDIANGICEEIQTVCRGLTDGG